MIRKLSIEKSTQAVSLARLGDRVECVLLALLDLFHRMVLDRGLLAWGPHPHHRCIALNHTRLNLGDIAIRQS
jgi:hypothetical protein